MGTYYAFTDLDHAPGPGSGLSFRFGKMESARDFSGALRLLRVSGRELLAPSLETTARVGADGGWLDGQRYPSRELRLRVQMLDRSRLPELSRRLGLGEKELEISDEPGWSYRAYYGGGELGDEVARLPFVDLVFYALDPFCYGPEHELEATEADGGKAIQLPAELTEPPALETLELTLGKSAKVLRLEGAGQTIALHGEAEAGGVYRLDFQRLEITYNRAPALARLDLLSDFETFELQPGAKLVLGPEIETARLRYRERKR